MTALTVSDHMYAAPDAAERSIRPIADLVSEAIQTWLANAAKDAAEQQIELARIAAVASKVLGSVAVGLCKRPAHAGASASVKSRTMYSALTGFVTPLVKWLRASELDQRLTGQHHLHRTDGAEGA